MQTKTWRIHLELYIYIPEIGDLIFKAYTKPFFDLLKFVLLLVSDCAHTIGSANSKLLVTIETAFGEWDTVGIQDGTHWFDGQVVLFLD